MRNSDIYKTKEWVQLRLEQLERDHYECQRCKHNGVFKNIQGMRKYTKATLVHHEFRTRKYPQYAYMPYVGNVRNLYSLCESCHEIIHKEERGSFVSKEDFNEERW